MELFQQLIELAAALGAVRFVHFQHGADVFLDCQSAENGGFLRQIADTEAGTPVHRHGSDVVAVDGDLAAIDRYEARDHVETGGFARAIRAKQPHGFTTAHDQRNAVDNPARIIGLRQTMRDQGAVIASLVGLRRSVHRSVAPTAKYF